jgi:parvulin-like peptidyl-prolyl isomerase
VRAPTILLVFATACVGCTGTPIQPEFVARLGSESLSRESLSQALDGLSVEMDSTAAAQRIIDQWVTNQLLFSEALQRGIDRQPLVRAGVADAQRAVVVDALMEELYANSAGTPTEVELQAYFQANRERLKLVEPYVRVRYLVTSNASAARDAQRQLAAMDSSAHGEWEELIASISDEPDLSRTLSRSLIPETRAFSEYPTVGQAVSATRPLRTSAVLTDRGRYHIVQVLERIPAGTVPELSWISQSLRQQLHMETRKLLYARLVERLRNEALAREQLDVR